MPISVGEMTLKVALRAHKTSLETWHAATGSSPFSKLYGFEHTKNLSIFYHYPRTRKICVKKALSHEFRRPEQYSTTGRGRKSGIQELGNPELWEGRSGREL